MAVEFLYQKIDFFLLQKGVGGLFNKKSHIIMRADFEILNLDPANNPTSHYGACHFGYNLARLPIAKKWVYAAFQTCLYIFSMSIFR